MSADGVIAKSANQNAFEWTSPEDKRHFLDLSKKIGAVLMGGSTFRASGRTNYPGRKGFVLTNHPQNYQIGENMFFVNGTAQEVIKQIAAQGIKQVALIGGAKTNQLFLQSGLVDEIYLTIEPLIFGQGLHLSDLQDLQIKLELQQYSKLNQTGTVLLHYLVKK